MQSGPGPARSLITLNERAPAGGGDRTDLVKGRMAMDGARAFMRPLDESGVTTLFTNPGTTELHLVEAAEATALAVASAVGRAVPRISVGTAVVVPIYPRHPQILASAAKTAQAATGGRFPLGIGLGAKDYGPWAVVTRASSRIRAALADHLADHAGSGAIMQRDELGADTEITRAPCRAGRPAVRRLPPGGRARLERWFPGPTPGGPGMRQGRAGGGCWHRQPPPPPGHRGYPHGSG